MPNSKLEFWTRVTCLLFNAGKTRLPKLFSKTVVRQVLPLTSEVDIYCNIVILGVEHPMKYQAPNQNLILGP